ncbi:papain-like cysteine protease family protein [Flavobacterium sp. DGU11]|uniref:Papain-like cysteine protease family protein n=1 Tax=Flavobacterium arundinis TaxID=3139143 RepID=A0ABU9HWW4_9FLAO
MPNRALPFSMQRQTQSNWCWAANAASISLFYNPHSGATQCEVACQCLDRGDCCNPNVPSACNVPYYLTDALEATGNFKQYIGNPILMPAIETEINGGWLIGVRIGWRDGGGHFVTIYGYNYPNANNFVYVADPIYGNSYISLANFTSNYQNAGDWTDTYLTTGQANNMLQFEKLNESLIERAREMAPPDILWESADLSPKGRDTSRQMAHKLYNINLDSLKGGNGVVFEVSGTRVFDRDKQKDNFIFEFANTFKGTDVSRILFGDKYARHYYKVFSELNESYRSISENYTISVVRLPALKVDAVWLHTDSSVDDIFIPLFTNDFLQADMRYTWQEFIGLLKENAKNARLYDDKMGG